MEKTRNRATYFFFLSLKSNYKRDGRATRMSPKRKLCRRNRKSLNYFLIIRVNTPVSSSVPCSSTFYSSFPFFRTIFCCLCDRQFSSPGPASLAPPLHWLRDMAKVRWCQSWWSEIPLYIRRQQKIPQLPPPRIDRIWIIYSSDL